MSYDSVDILQRALTEEVFHYAKDAKKAAGSGIGYIGRDYHFLSHQELGV